MNIYPVPKDHYTSSLERELRKREFEIDLLKEITSAVSSQLRMENVLQLIAARAHALIQAETVLIPILNEACSEYTYKAGFGKNADEIVGATLPIDFGICGWVWKNRRAWWRGVLDELEAEERTKWEAEAGSVILVPMIGKQHFLGGIAGLHKKVGGDFTKNDLDLLSLFAAQVSIAIENAINYEALAEAKSVAESYQVQLERVNVELASTNKELEKLAMFDSLTGLPNRLLVQDRMQQALFSAGRNNYPLSILIIDLDHFKEVNDTLGHAIGDQLLTAVGERFNSVLRKTDTVGRLGGDEFAVIVPHADTKAALRVANELIKALETPIEFGANSFSIQASLGIAVYPEHGQDVTSLLKHADVAMYVAKRNKLGCAIYDIKEDPHSTTRLAILSDLHQALSRNELLLYYQPIVDLRSDRIVGVEALTRWLHSERGMIGPDEFIPLLEKTGLIHAFTASVLDMALAQCASWKRAGLDLNMAVNLSTLNMHDPLFVDHFMAMIGKWGVAPGTVTLEITESTAMSESPIALETLNALDRTGVRFSIDDFGTGHSSLSRLKRLPVHELKIDRSFVKDMLHNEDDAMIVRSTIELAHNLRLSVTAEGVEDEPTYQRLKELRCDYAQGYHIAKPTPAADLVRFLNTSSTARRHRSR